MRRSGLSGASGVFVLTMIAEVVIGRFTSFLPTSAPRSPMLNTNAVDQRPSSLSAHYVARSPSAPSFSSALGGVTAPHIVGKGRAEAHPKSPARVTASSPRATLRLTREANPKRTLRAEVAQRLNVLISAQRVAPPHILSKSP